MQPGLLITMPVGTTVDFPRSNCRRNGLVSEPKGGAVKVFGDGESAEACNLQFSIDK